MLSDAEWERALVDSRAGWETDEQRLRAAHATQALVDDRSERERQLAEAQVARERAEARNAEWRGLAIHLRSHLELIACHIDSGYERDLADARVAVEDALNELTAVYCAPDPGADWLADARAQHAALRVLVEHIADLSDCDGECATCPDDEREECAECDVLMQAREALARGVARGWDRPAEGEEAGW